MPRIGEVLGVLIYVYAEDHNPPHIHAIYGDEEMKIEIATGTVLAGSLPGSKQALALNWLRANRAAALDAWARMNP